MRNWKVLGICCAVLALPCWATTPKQALANELIRCGSLYNALSVVDDHSKEDALREQGAAYMQAAMNVLAGDAEYFNRELQRGADEVANAVLISDTGQRQALAQSCEKYAASDSFGQTVTGGAAGLAQE